MADDSKVGQVGTAGTIARVTWRQGAGILHHFGGWKFETKAPGDSMSFPQTLIHEGPCFT